MCEELLSEDGAKRRRMRKKAMVVGSLVFVNVVIWTITVTVLASQRLLGKLLATSTLAYTLGLRHALDADHLCAIDNVTRRISEGGEAPLLVGLFFSLGHSTVVLVACAVLAITLGTIQPRIARVGKLIGTSISTGFLLLIALINTVILIRIWKSIQNAQAAAIDEEQQQQVQHVQDFKCLGVVTRMVDRSWKMYPLGVLFGLGFDTSTEVALLALSVTESSKGMPAWIVMVYPLLFTAGMSLLDTLDGLAMSSAYRFALEHDDNMNKLYYNLIITGLSVAMALLVASLQAVSIVGDQLKLHGGFWAALDGLSGVLGYIILGLFLFTWLLALLLYRCYKRPSSRSNSL